MNAAVFRVKSLENDVQVGCIARGISSEDGVGDVIRQLDQARGLGIDEKRYVHQVAKDSPARSMSAELLGELLEAGLVGTFVQDDESTLRVLVHVVESSELQVEPAAQFFEGHLHWIAAAVRRFVDRAGKGLCALVRIREYLEDVFYDLSSFFLFHAFPGWFSPGKDVRRMEFDGPWVLWENPRGDVVEFLGNPVDLAFEDGYPAQHEVRFRRVRCRPGIVQVEEVHGRSPKKWAARRGRPRRTAITQLSQPHPKYIV